MLTVSPDAPSKGSCGSSGIRYPPKSGSTTTTVSLAPPSASARSTHGSIMRYFRAAAQGPPVCAELRACSCDTRFSDKDPHRAPVACPARARSTQAPPAGCSRAGRGPSRRSRRTPSPARRAASRCRPPRAAVASQAGSSPAAAV